MAATQFVAAGAAPPFFTEVALLLVLGAAMAYFFHRLGVLSIVSFLLTGALIGPHALGLIRNEAVIEATAEVGVILLLFTIGIEFSLEKLGRIKKLIFVGGGLQVGLVLLIVSGALILLGVPWQAAVFTGCLVALSSTAIVMKLLMSQGETNTEGGQAALGILIFQDLAVVAMVLLVPMLGGDAGSGWGIGLALAKAGAIVAVVLLVARRVMPKILEAVARTCSQEIFLLSVVAICFGTAYLTSLAGVSLSLGAFLAGLVVSESRFSEMAFGEILPLQILFSATFFVSVGLLLDPGFLLREPLLCLGLMVGVVVLKALTTGISLKVLGYGAGTLGFSSLMLAQVGEFSFVLERAGREVGLFPAGMAERGSQAFIAVTVVLMVLTPALAQLGKKVRSRKEEKATARKVAAVATPDEAAATAVADRHGELRDHVVLAGYGGAAKALAPILQRRGVPYLILTLSPDGALHAEDGDLPVLRGNYTRRHELTLAGIEHARLLVVADDDPETTHRVVAAAHGLNPDLPILARTRFASGIAHLEHSGATAVVAEDLESVMALVAEALRRAEELEETPAAELQALRRALSAEGAGQLGQVVSLNERQRQTEHCSHVSGTQPVRPGAAGCEECLRHGQTWVHLRVCMTCGFVGCCDSSVGKHASAHAREAEHPLVKSFEPGEDWAWCYEDEVIL
ncbi:MAG: cation:proton antiporter [Acidobacteriota bacterium]|nr:cation:proton antiporter [Acidobacteriota bacterium]